MGPVDGCNWNCDVTFPYMAHRRLHRTIGGTYDKRGKFVQWSLYLFWFLITLVSLSGLDEDSGSSEVITVLFAAVLLNLLIRFFFLASKLIILWFYAGWVSLYIRTGDSGALFNFTPEENETYRSALIFTWVFIIVLSTITAITSAIEDHIYPALVQQGRFPIVGWFRAQVGDFPSEIVYLSKVWRISELLFGKTKRRINYAGGVDADGRPHGAGQWEELATHGELLRGYFQHGVPIGPFVSTEKGSGYAFHSLRIGLVHNRLETDLSSNWMIPKRNPAGVSYGVGAVECSVSGKFFKWLPHLTWIAEPTLDRGMLSCIENLVSPIDAILRRKDNDHIMVTAADQNGPGGILMGHVDLTEAGLNHVTIRRRKGEADPLPTFGMMREVEEGGTKPPAEEPAAGQAAPLMPGRNTKLPDIVSINLAITKLTRPLEIDNVGDTPFHSNASAMVFFPGFNCPAIDGMNTLAQLLALGDFPPTILPFVFSWPNATVLTYHMAQDQADSPELAQDFQTFVKDLTSCGITKMHMIGHSMGARACLGVFKGFEGVVKQLGSQGEGSMMLETVTLISPEYFLEDFVPYGGMYDLVRKYTDVLTIYADRNDFALWSAELFGKFRPALGKHPYSLHRPQDAIVEREAKTDASVAEEGLAADQLPLASEGTEILHLMRVCNSSLHGWDGPDQVAREIQTGAEQLDRQSMLYRSKKQARSGNQQSLRFLDLDVIDTTWLESNVHAIRHSFFNLNPILVEDLRETIMFRRRARHRARTVHKSDNTWVYMVCSC
ncbi:unnamed protein product [Chrysoparadoxa australica]